MTEAEVSASTEPAPEYAVIEIFGHRRLAGRILEVERFGTKMLRIDIPERGKFENGFTSQMYGGVRVATCSSSGLVKRRSLHFGRQPR